MIAHAYTYRTFWMLNHVTTTTDIKVMHSQLNAHRWNAFDYIRVDCL